jgi:signal peptidase II
MIEHDTSLKPARHKHCRFLSRADMPGPTAHLIFWPIAAIGVAIDLWSKHAAFGWLNTRPLNEFSVIDGFVKLVMRENSGAAFSIASGRTSALIAVSIIALFVVVAIFLLGSIQHKIAQIALALFTAGIIGNLYDRIFNNGFVRDFIDVVYWPGKHWPAFNVADSMLCIAVGLLLISNITSAYSRRPAHPQK